MDILVTFREPNDIDLFKFIELRLFLKDKLGIDVDLVEKDTIKPRIKARIFEKELKFEKRLTWIFGELSGSIIGSFFCFLLFFQFFS